MRAAAITSTIVAVIHRSRAPATAPASRPTKPEALHHRFVVSQPPF